jgi:hypothetical protein
LLRTQKVRVLHAGDPGLYEVVGLQACDCHQ